MRRLPSPPPELAGYSYLRALGTGGFADVYLYEQNLPRRQVAVKVLTPGISDEAMRAMFLVETTLMAQLSAHPAVLTVYEASVAPDGRPYLVMEYCPRGYGGRFRTESITLDEVLGTGIAVGGVLETAHRNGLLHRDMKPANILITGYGRAVVSDFGIASSIVQAESGGVMGLSVPWSAPEVIAGTTTGSVRSEVWGFAATLYGLLAGRSPFELPGRDNSREAIAARILGRMALPPLGRADVPERLERLIGEGLARDPERRPASVLDLVRELQLVETELGLRPSPVDLIQERHLDISALEAAAPTRSSTTTGGRLRRVRRESTGTGSGSSSSSSRNSESGVSQVIDRTVLRTAARETHRARTLPWLLGAGAALLCGGGLTAFILAGEGGDRQIPRVDGVESSLTATAARFAWPDPGLAPGDRYLVRVNGGSGIGQDGTEISLATDEYPGRVCITIAVVRAGVSGPVSADSCVRSER
ncbi:serine/threonine-protein kinase [Mycetocola spongiae]|uniref:serine/threonine-protein kinase n=1 Tax=Mycetocola spongiae TaxID=2859226 RepID=UPI001CF5E11D|nr:serine/threonine-protein kinase [Mycetocola spongiae]UCR89972.1 serine/threonine protein kinase [Mycetocola spongiae]